MPDPVKSDEKLYFTPKDAKRQLTKLQEEVGPYYGLYEATVEVTKRVE